MQTCLFIKFDVEKIHKKNEKYNSYNTNTIYFKFFLLIENSGISLTSFIGAEDKILKSISKNEIEKIK